MIYRFAWLLVSILAGVLAYPMVGQYWMFGVIAAVYVSGVWLWYNRPI